MFSSRALLKAVSGGLRGHQDLQDRRAAEAEREATAAEREQRMGYNELLSSQRMLDIAQTPGVSFDDTPDDEITPTGTRIGSVGGRNAYFNPDEGSAAIGRREKEAESAQMRTMLQNIIAGNPDYERLVGGVDLQSASPELMSTILRRIEGAETHDRNLARDSSRPRAEPSDVNWQTVTQDDGTMVQVHPRTGQVRPLNIRGRAPGAGDDGLPSATTHFNEISEDERFAELPVERRTDITQRHRSGVPLDHLRPFPEMDTQMGGSTSMASSDDNRPRMTAGAGTMTGLLERVSRGTADASVPPTDAQREWDRLAAQFGEERTATEIGPRP